VKDRKVSQILPKLRFPEFRDEPGWKAKHLFDLLDYEQPTPYLVRDIRYQNVGTPVLTANKSFIIGYTSESTGIYQNVPVIIFDDFTTDIKYVNFPFKVKSSAIKILSSLREIELKLVYELMSQIKFDPAQHKRYYISEYQYLKIPFPEPDEQQKIADCIGSLDDMIVSSEQKLEALRLHKQGLLQQLFPQPGENRPRLRFPEFRNSNDWPIKPLGEIFDEINETGFPGLSLLSVTGQYGVIFQKDLNRRTTANLNKGKYLRVIPGDIVYDTMRMWEGRSARTSLEGLVSPAYTVCRPKTETDGFFFAYYFKTSAMIDQFRKYSQGLVKDTLSLKYYAFSQIPAAFPSLIEQQKIANCLGSLDDLIATSEQKLEALKQHKQGLMQNLFPNLVKK